MLERAKASSKDSNSGLMPHLEDKSTTPQENVISIPLPDEFSALAVSSDPQFFNSFMDIITPLDRDLTVFSRLPGAFGTVYTGKFTVGAVNKGLSENQSAAIAFYVLLAVHALYCNYLSRVAQKKKDNDIQNIYKLFKQKKEDDVQIPDGAEKDRQKIIEDAIRNHFIEEVRSLNEYIDRIVEHDTALKDKYDKIYINPTSKALCFKRKVEAQNAEIEQRKKDENFFVYWGWKRLLKGILWASIMVPTWEYFIKPLYNSGVVASVAFWLFWIGAAATTGQQDLMIAGVSPWVGVGVPAGLGLINLGSYYYNAWKYGGFEKARQKAEADADFQVVMKALLLREHERDIARLEDQKKVLAAELKKRKIAIKPILRPTTDDKLPQGVRVPDGVFDQPLVKGTFTLISDSASKWSSSQGLAWYGKVLLETAFTASMVAPFVGETIGVLGAVMLGLACVFGIASGYTRYREAKGLNDELEKAGKDGKKLVTLDEFEAYYKKRVEYLDSLKTTMQDYKKAHEGTRTPHYVVIPRVFDIVKKDLEPTSGWGKCKAKIIDASMYVRNHPVVGALDAGLVGIGIGRILFATAGLFLVAPPILLTGPAGVAAILAVGLVYIGMKWYEKYQKKKEERIRELPNEELEENIKKAELVVHDIKMSERLIEYDNIAQKRPIAERGSDYTPDPLHKSVFSNAMTTGCGDQNESERLESKGVYQLSAAVN